MKFASIDIGSNAVRMLFAQVFTNGEIFLSKDALIRIPIRLGEDSFTLNTISDEKREKLVSTMVGFKHLIDAYKPLDFIACATAAMREADNAQQIIEEIKEKSGIEVEVISGHKEAERICMIHLENSLFSNAAHLYIDVGGGSTEMTLWSDNQVIASESFNIGTVRLLKERVTEEQWKSMKKWVKDNIRKHKDVTAIGSGGNINKLYKFAGRKEQTHLSIDKLKKLYHYLDALSLEDRIKKLKLHTDRADVIIHAINIFLKIMKWADIQKIYVPQFGLSDGLIRTLYEKHNIKQEF